MPRPKNLTLREFFYNSDKPTEIVCTFGNCNGRKLSDRAGNLERHLRTMHPVCYAAYLKKQKGTSGAKRIAGDAHITKVPCEINKRNIKAAVAELFINNSIPLRVMEDRAFKMLVKPVFDALNMSVSVQSVLEQTVSYSQSAKQQLIKELKGRLLSLKIDASTRQNVGILGINVQYAKKSRIEHQTLAIKMLGEHQNSEQLVALVLEVLTEYNIGTNQIISLTTDNGSYTLPNHLESSLGDYKIRESTNKALELIGSNFLAAGVINVACGSHELYCCAQDVVNATIFIENIEKWRSVASQIKCQTNCGIELELDNRSRWCTTYVMFEALHASKDLINSEILSGNWDFEITSADWNFLEHYLDLFKVVLHAINKLQSQGLCYGDFYITIMDSIFQLKNLPNSDMKTRLLEALNRKKSRLLECDLFVSAVFLDPRVKVTLTLGQIVRAKHFIEHLHKQLIYLKDNVGSCAQQDLNKMDETSDSTHVPKTLDELLQTLENQSRSSMSMPFNSNQTPIEVDDYTPSSSSQVSTTIDGIIPMPSFEIDMLMYDRQTRLPLGENVLEYWSKQHNSLSSIAETVLAIPFSQVNLNRIDTTLKYLLSEESRTISFTNLEQILFLKANDSFNYVC